MRSSKALTLTIAFIIVLFANIANAGTMALLGAGGTGGGGGGGFSHTFEFVGSQYIAFAATATYAAVPIGTASADRIVIVEEFGDYSSNPIAAPTICGVTGTAGGYYSAAQAGVWYANITTGTSCTIIANEPSGGKDLGIAVWIIQGQSGGAGAAPSSSNGVSPITAEPISITVTVPTSGFAAVAGYCGGAASNAFTWTSATADSAVLTGAGGSTPVLAAADATASATVTGSSGTGACNYGGQFLYSSWGP